MQSPRGRLGTRTVAIALARRRPARRQLPRGQSKDLGKTRTILPSEPRVGASRAASIARTDSSSPLQVRLDRAGSPRAREGCVEC